MSMKKFLISIVFLMPACEIEIRVPTVYVIDTVYDTSEDIYDTSADVYEFDDTTDRDWETMLIKNFFMLIW